MPVPVAAVEAELRIVDTTEPFRVLVGVSGPLRRGNTGSDRGGTDTDTAPCDPDTWGDT